MKFKPEYKGEKLENVGDYLNKVSRGTGVVPDKKKSKKDFRKEKHEKTLRDYK